MFRDANSPKLNIRPHYVPSVVLYDKTVDAIRRPPNLPAKTIFTRSREQTDPCQNMYSVITIANAQLFQIVL